MEFIVASSKKWHHPSFKDFQFHIKGEWHWVDSPIELEKTLGQISPRYIFFLHWNWLVPDSIYLNHECVCFHMTDVPYGRGGSPLQNLIVKGHTETKLTALRMVAEMDAGPVYTKRPLSLEGTAHEIFLRAGLLSFDIIQWIIECEPQPIEQTGEPVIFKRRKPEQSRLPKVGSFQNLYDHIRMLDAPTYPLAFVEHGDYILEFSEANIEDGQLTAIVHFRKQQN